MGNKKIREVNILELIENVRTLIKDETNMAPALKAALELLISVCMLLAEKHPGRNSKNSSLPPAMDPNRTKTSKAKGRRKPGGQEGHPGTTLQQVSDPDEIKTIKVDRTRLPPGEWKEAGFEKRQVFDIRISRFVTEYQAEIVINGKGGKVTAGFPEGVVQAAQYGNGVKAHGVYMSVEQMIPCERVSEHFDSQMGLPISAGSVCNFKREAYEMLETYEEWVVGQLQNAKITHHDETGINIGAKRVWLHSTSNEQFTHYYPHENRGKKAMDAIGIIGNHEGILIHDGWPAYYSYQGKVHALCNAHHIRELSGAEEEGQKWAGAMISLLLTANEEAGKAGGKLTAEGQEQVRKKYRRILRGGEEECPLPQPPKEKKRGRIPKTKARNLLERLRDYEDDVLRFMTDKDVPFTNNQAERDIRMAKLQQKISGCFRSWEGAYIFSRIRGYLSTSEKHNVTSAEALNLLFNGKFPEFMAENV